MNMEWPKIFAVNTSRTLEEGEAFAWYQELCDDIPDFKEQGEKANDDEIVGAIRWAYSENNPNPPTKKKFDLTKNDIRKWVLTARCIGRGAADTSKHDRCRRIFDELKAAITLETDPCKIWDLICTPRVEDGFKDKVYSVLEVHAIREHPEWHRPAQYIADKFKDIREAMEQVSDHMKEDPGNDKDPRYDIGKEGWKHR